MKEKRRGRPRVRSNSAPAVLVVTTVPKKRKQWSDQSMRLAIKAVKSGSTILRVAILHGVPRQTLQDRISGKVVHGINPGPKPYLSSVQEEKDLAGFLIDSAKVGYGKSRDQVKSIAACGACDKGLLKPDKVMSQ